MASSLNNDSAEIWKPIPGWEEFYEISTAGRVRSLDRLMARRTRDGVLGKCIRKGRVLSGGKTRKGYKTVSLKHPLRKGITREIHRLVCIVHNGPPPSPAHHASHVNGIKTDNRSENLRWATPKENQADQYAHGTRRLGERHPLSKLTDVEVLQIRRMAAGGAVLADIDRYFGLSKGHSHNIVRRLSWKHI